jgi:hypothetical protein
MAKEFGQITNIKEHEIQILLYYSQWGKYGYIDATSESSVLFKVQFLVSLLEFFYFIEIF